MSLIASGFKNGSSTISKAFTHTSSRDYCTMSYFLGQQGDEAKFSIAVHLIGDLSLSLGEISMIYTGLARLVRPLVSGYRARIRMLSLAVLLWITIYYG